MRRPVPAKFNRTKTETKWRREVGSQRSENRSQKSEIRNQKSVGSIEYGVYEDGVNGRMMNDE